MKPWISLIAAACGLFATAAFAAPATIRVVSGSPAGAPTDRARLFRHIPSPAPPAGAPPRPPAQAARERRPRKPCRTRRAPHHQQKT